MFEVSVPSPRYPTPDPYYLGNALSNLVNNYQQAQQGQQRTQANDIRNQEGQLLLNQQKAFAGGVPMNPDGTPNYSAIMKTLAEKGDIGSISSLAPIIQQEQNIEGANAPDRFFGGGYSNGGSVAPPAKGPWSGNSFLSTLVGAESEGNNSAVGDSGQAKGDFQFHDQTWQKYAKNVPGASQYASAADAPPEVQQAVAETAPISEWGPRTKAILHAKFGAFDESQTIGQLAGEFGGGGGVKVASAGASDAPAAYANPDQPAIPPVSAAAGSTIPRANAPTAAAAVGGAAPNPLSASNPAWAGINAALPVSPPANPPLPPSRPGGSYGPPHAGGSPTNPIISEAAYTGAPAAPQAAQAPASVASIASAAGIPPQVADNIAKVVGAAPDAPLTPQQQLRAKAIIQNYAARTGQQGPAAGQGQPQAGGPIIPQFPLPKGFTDPQQAILAIDQDIARLSRFGPAAAGRIKALEDMRGRIAASSAPMDVRPGQTILDPRTGKTLFQASPTSASNVALQRFLEENPNASAEKVQQFLQLSRGNSRSGVGMYMQRFLQENPNATAEDVARAAQNYQSGGSALTKFTSGPQGNAIRSFNVLVDHLGTLDSAVDALKNGDISSFNRVAQIWAQNTGNPAPTNFDAVKSIVGDELVKAIIGGGGALGDREEVKATIDKANSPKQLYGVINQYKKLALGQLRGLRTQYSEATGRDDFDRFLAPGTRSFFGDEGKSEKQDTTQGSSGKLPPGWSVEVH